MTQAAVRAFLDPGEIAEGKFDLDVFGNGRYQTAAARSGNSIPKNPNLYRRGYASFA
jgi:hypothetical protein